jgi:hypothetical protein
MANEVMTPLLPCRSIDEIAGFYRVLGFEVTYRQTRPNPYIVVEREDFRLHFFGIEDFEPANSYGSCLVSVPDTGRLYRAFAEGVRAAYGKLLVSGIPRMTRPRIRKNTGSHSGFSVIDPGGNWIRIFQATAEATGEEPTGRLAKTLRNAIVLGESKGDHAQAARILDGTLSELDDSANVADRVKALVYRAELAIRLDDGERADALLAEVRATTLTEADRERLTDALADARDLELTRE